jgi:hypothetical protein
MELERILWQRGWGNAGGGILARRSERLQALLEVFGERDTPAFLRKSAETIDWKRIVKHSWGRERKERRRRVPKRANTEDAEKNREKAPV